MQVVPSKPSARAKAPPPPVGLPYRLRPLKTHFPSKCPVVGRFNRLQYAAHCGRVIQKNIEISSTASEQHAGVNRKLVGQAFGGNDGLDSDGHSRII